MSDSTMTATDRRELRKVAKGRFDILEEQLAMRASEVRSEIGKTIDADVAPVIKKYNKKRDTLVERQRRMEARHKEEIKKLEAEWQEARLDGIEEGVEADSISLKSILDNMNRGYGKDGNFSAKDRQERINDAERQVKRQHGLGKINLKQLQLEISEELAVGALQSDEAKQFLGKIPSVDKLLPAPTKAEIKELLAGS